MKKVLSALICGVCLLLLCACGGGDDAGTPPDFPEKFSGDAAVSIGDYTLLSHVQYAPEYLEVTFQSPEALRKMKMTYSGDVCSVTYDDLSLSLDASDFPQSSFGKIILHAMRQCAAKADITVSRTENGWLYTGTVGEGSFEALQDASTGAITRISCPELEVTITFSDVQTQG